MILSNLKSFKDADSDANYIACSEMGRMDRIKRILSWPIS